MTIRNLLIKNPLIACIPLFLLVCNCMQVMADDVLLEWDPSISPGVTGYKVYVGNSSGNYETPTTIGNQTTYTVTSLTTGTWYFAVTAIDGSGNESGFSNEVSLVISSPCDVNGDTSVNSVDVQAITNVILDVAPGSSAYDINSDTNINVLDLQILNNFILGAGSCP